MMIIPITMSLSLALHIVGVAVLLLIVFAIGFQVGRLRELDNRLRELDHDLAWATVKEAQASFNVDFFEELWANDDPRLTRPV